MKHLVVEKVTFEYQLSKRLVSRLARWYRNEMVEFAFVGYSSFTSYPNSAFQTLVDML